MAESDVFERRMRALEIAREMSIDHDLDAEGMFQWANAIYQWLETGVYEPVPSE